MLQNIKNNLKSKLIKFSIERYKKEIIFLENSISFYEERVDRYKKYLAFCEENGEEKKSDAIMHVYIKTLDTIDNELKELSLKRMKLEKISSM